MKSPADIELPIHGTRVGGIGSQREEGTWHRWAFPPEVPIRVVDLYHIKAFPNLSLVSAHTANSA